jgi:hypothetical protein
VALLPLMGCALASDLLNLDFIKQLGIDPATISPSQGTVVVAFVNKTTASSVSFNAYSVANVADLRQGARNFSATVTGAGVENQIVDCPVEALGPGSLTASFGVSSLAATVTTTTGVSQVQYTGLPLRLGESFHCGDLVEIALSTAAETATTQPSVGAQGYVLTIRRVPPSQ